MAAPTGTNSPSTAREGQAIAVALEERAVAHRLVGEEAFFGRAEIRDVLAWLRLLADPSVRSVNVLARRKPRVADARITCHIVDFAALPPLHTVDEVYLALGTTIKQAGSQAAFRAVDYEANLAVAKAALAAGARRAGLVSAMGADAGSRIFYSRVKGAVWNRDPAWH